MPNVLVTGAAGSVGRELVSLLAQRGFAVRAFDLPTCDFSPVVDLPGVSIFPGDIAEAAQAREAVAGVETIIHLAALLHPVSEWDRERTFRVNVDGTRNLVAAAQRSRPLPHLILASSVATYGDTSRENPPVSPGHPQHPMDTYAESKIAAERVVLAAGIPYTILRISGIAVPLVLEPPAVWPFQAGQRIEFVSRSDAARALAACVRNHAAQQQVFNIAGGPAWQMRGREYVESLYRMLEIPSEEAKYAEVPGWFDWYDTTGSQAVLGYQQTSYVQFLGELKRAVEVEFV